MSPKEVLEKLKHERDYMSLIQFDHIADDYTMAIKCIESLIEKMEKIKNSVVTESEGPGGYYIATDVIDDIDNLVK